MAQKPRNPKDAWQEGRVGTDGVEQVKVTFLRTVQFECDGRKKGPKFHKDKDYTFDRPFADRWIKRGAAYETAHGAPEVEEDEAPVAPLQKGGASAGAEEYKPT
jgi:hypothetical protein